MNTKHQRPHKVLLMEEILHELMENIHFSQVFMDNRWCRISAINSMTGRQSNLRGICLRSLLVQPPDFDSRKFEPRDFDSENIRK